MKTTTGFVLMTAVALAVPDLSAAEEVTPVARWSFEEVREHSVADAVGNHAGTVNGKPQQVAGVDGQALKFDGGFVTVPSAPTLQFTDAGFSIAAWVNPYELDAGQQMIVAKNVYSANQREWGLMLDNDNRFRFYLWENGWKTLASPTEPRPGHWHHVAVTFEKGHARLYVNGKQEAEGTLAPALSVTDAPLTIGGRGTGGLTPPRSPVSVTDAPLTIGGRGTGGLTPPRSPASVTDAPLTIGGRGTGGLTPPRSPVSVTDAPLTIDGRGTGGLTPPRSPVSVTDAPLTLGVGLAWHKGTLCIGYTHKSHAANELAVIPIRSLEIKP